MIKIRKSKDRGYFDFGWLKTHHTFSFGDYRNPAQMGFRTLRVINEDYVAPGQGFPTHPHKDMEIISYVVSGQLAHKDSMGNGSTIVPGEVQYMCAGTGVTHSEYNPSKTEPLHLLQLWIIPPQKNLPPSYTQEKIQFTKNEMVQTVPLHQDASIRVCKLESGKAVSYKIGKDRGIWLQLVHGKISFMGHTLEAGDGASLEELPFLQIEADKDSEFLLFDLK